MIIFLALADGVSQVSCGPLTLHTRFVQVSAYLIYSLIVPFQDSNMGRRKVDRSQVSSF